MMAAQAHVTGTALSRLMYLFNVAQPGLPLRQCVFLDTWALAHMRKGQVPSCIKRWHLNLDQADLVFVPVHVNSNHWALIVAHKRRRTLTYLDSLCGNDPTSALTAVAEGLGSLQESWTLINHVGCPQQTNAHDCGIFVGMATELLAHGLPLAFTAANVQHSRQRFAAYLCDRLLSCPVRAWLPLPVKPPFVARERKSVNAAGTTVFMTANLRTRAHLPALISTLVSPTGADIVALPEVKCWEGETLEAEGFDYHAFHEPFLEGHDFVKNRHAGCGLLTRTTLRDRILPLPDHSRPNMGWIRIRSTLPNTRDRYVCVFYSICRSQDAEKADEGFDMLHKAIAYFKPKGEVIIMGDFNAHVGATLGPNSLPGVDESGVRLSNLVEDLDLVAINCQSFCEGKVTRMQAGEESVIDFILMERAAVYAPGAPKPNCRVEEATFYGSDHRAVWTRALDESARSRPTKGKYLAWEFRRLGNDVNWNKFAAPLAEEVRVWNEWLNSTRIPNRDDSLSNRRAFVNSAASVFAKSVLIAAEKHFERTKVGSRCRPWWTARLEELFLAKSAAYSVHLAAAKSGQPASVAAAAKEALRIASRRLAHAISKAKQTVEDDRADAAERLYTEPMAHAARPNHALYWRDVKRANGKQTQMPATLLDATETRTLTGKEAIEARWHEYYSGMAVPTTKPSDPEHDAALDTEVAQVAAAMHIRPGLDEPITVGEVIAAQRGRLTNFKAGSPVDSLLPELLKRHGPEPDPRSDKEHPFEFLTTALTRLFNLVLELEVVPDAWKMAAILPIYKQKGSREDCSNYRPISLLSVLGKLLDSILTTRMHTFLEQGGHLNDHQWAFRHGRSAPDLVWLVSEVVERRREENLHTFMCAIDVTKAYDTVFHTGLFAKLARTGLDGKLWRIFRDWYTENQSTVLVNGVQSAPFTNQHGVRQGAPSSPDLYSVFINDVIDDVKNAGLGISVEDVWVGIVLFADDMLLLADTEQDLRAMMEVVETTAARWHYQISDRKSQVMVTSVTTRSFAYVPDVPFTFNSAPVSVVDFIKYLGVEITATGSWREVVQRLRRSARARFGMLAAGGVNMYGYHVPTGVRVYNTMVRPIVEYGADVWTPDATRSRELETLHNWAARTITGLNSWTAVEAVHADIGFYRAETRRDELKLRRFYRLHAMPNDWLVKKVYAIRRQDWLSGRRRPLGHPWFYETEAVAERVGLRGALTDPDTALERVTKAEWHEMVKDAVQRHAAATWRDGAAEKSSLHLLRRVKEAPEFEHYLKEGSREQRRTMLRLRAGVLPVPATLQRRDHELTALATPPPCPACSRVVRADELHMLVDCPAVESQRDIMWQAITSAIHKHERVDASALLMSSTAARLNLLLLAGPLPGIDGKPVPHSQARNIVRVVLKYVHILWRAFETAVQGAAPPKLQRPDAPST